MSQFYFIYLFIFLLIFTFRFTVDQLRQLPLNSVLEYEHLLPLKRGRSPSPINVPETELNQEEGQDVSFSHLDGADGHSQSSMEINNQVSNNNLKDNFLRLACKHFLIALPVPHLEPPLNFLVCYTSFFPISLKTFFNSTSSSSP